MRLSIILLFVVFTVFVAGCSSQSGSSRVALKQIDRDYVDTVNRQATVGGVDVYWINPPQKEKNED
ncbi:hypothetical protein [Idiomarina aminovorans]|uniref:hypothetical protein n=1 Tax=Idiomarina aminovorans TaxID=2914829 RepID=UPI0020033160|nr:hypothetical protein [Idiomarina sp. ATCH4]MCK7459552.1 hypothetical protein [Idiomarina sp. ATCH4]